MSIWNSNLLCVEEIEDLRKNYTFTVPEIESLFERFKYLDRSNVQSLSFAEFHMIPEFYSNPFSKLIMEYLERKTSYEKITFRTFVEFMSLFNEKTDRKKRMEFAFDIFDLKKEGRISRGDLNVIYKMITGSEDYNEVSEVLRIYDKESKGYLDYKDFAIFYNEDPDLDKCMLIDFTKNIENAKDENIWEILWPGYSKDKNE